MNNRELGLLKDELTKNLASATLNSKMEYVGDPVWLKLRVSQLIDTVEEQDILIENLVAEIRAIRQELGALQPKPKQPQGWTRL